MSEPPLRGRRILVTRAAHQAGKLSEALRALGAEPVEVPVLELRPPESFAALDAALRNLSEFDWLILTSANSVRFMCERVREFGIGPLSPENLKNLKVAAVGASTAKSAEDAGFQVTIIPESYVAERLVEALRGEAAGKKVLIVRAAVARDIIPDALREAGTTVTIAEAYQNVLPPDAGSQLQEALASGIEAATFTSSSSVNHLQQAAFAAGVAWPLKDVKAISIGPITSQTLRDSGWQPAIEARVSDIAGLAAAANALFSPGNS